MKKTFFVVEFVVEFVFLLTQNDNKDKSTNSGLIHFLPQIFPANVYECRIKCRFYDKYQFVDGSAPNKNRKLKPLH